MVNTVELLAPAKDAQTAKEAILAGADAVYIGAQLFGARKQAANSLEDIAKLCDFAHRFGVKVYIALNTILSDQEVLEARKLAWDLYHAGADAFIVQDFALLGNGMPPLPLHASTQCNIDSPEKAKFAECAGFETVVLPREFSLAEISETAKNASATIECFVHGALCVCRSGQCYLSYAIGSRSGNRGNCAQPCRMKYSLKDAENRDVFPDGQKYWLSLKDMARADYLAEMLASGVRCFKIEGRLKDAAYVKNITAFYSRAIDRAIEASPLKRASCGVSAAPFEPDLQKTFSRGFTPYHICGTQNGCASFDSPKSRGEFIFETSAPSKGFLVFPQETPLHAGDGLFIEQKRGKSFGARVQRVDGNKAALGHGTVPEKIDAGAKVWRNLNINFDKLLSHSCERKIPVEISAKQDGEYYVFSMGNSFCGESVEVSERIKISSCDIAKNAEAAKSKLAENLSKLGDSQFKAEHIDIDLPSVAFFKASEINAVRRTLAEKLSRRNLEIFDARKKSFVPRAAKIPDQQTAASMPADFTANVMNDSAKDFYKAMGVSISEYALEKSPRDLRGVKVMKTKHCILRETGLCKRDGKFPKDLKEPLRLQNEECSLKIRFDCAHCGMDIFFESGKNPGLRACGQKPD